MSRLRPPNPQLLIVALLIASGCTATEPVSWPSRPPVPQGWVEVAKGGVRIAAPPEWGPEFSGDPQSILLSALVAPGNNDAVNLIAIGPHGEYQPDLPITDASLADWLLKVTTKDVPDSSSRSVVRLPSGRAVLVRATYHTAAPDGFEAALYAIPTTIGVVYLQIVIDLDLMERYGTTMELIPRLLEIVQAGAVD